MQAREVLRLIEFWKKQPIICEPRTVEVMVGAKPQKPIAVRFSARTFAAPALHSIPLTVVCDDARLRPLIKAWVADKGEDGDERVYHFYGREVIVQIAPEAMEKGFETTLVVSSARYPNFEARVSLRVEVE